MATHDILLRVLQNLLKERDRVRVTSLTKTVGELMFQQRRLGGKGRSDGLNSRKGVLGRGLQASHVLQGKEGTEAAREGLGLVDENFAQGGDGPLVVVGGSRHGLLLIKECSS